MGSIALPALDLKPVQQPDLLAQYAQIQQIRGQQQQQQIQAQEAPLRMQALQQGAQEGQITLQQAQQGQKDQQAFRAALSDPSNQGKTIGEVADTLAHAGALSPTTYQQLKKADFEQRSEIAKLTSEQLDAAAKGHAQTQELYNNIMNLPDDQLAAQWPQIAQQYDAIPGNNKQPLNPQQPLTRQQLQQFGPLLSMQGSYIQQEAAKKTAAAALAEKQADAQLHQLQADRGGTTDLDKYSFDYMKSHNLPDTPQNRQAAFHAYTKETKLDPAQIRANTYLQMPQAIADPNNPGQTIFTTRQGAIGKEAPNSGDVKAVQATQKFFSPAGKGGQSLAAFNTAQNHLQLLGQAAEALHNGNSTLLNSVANSFANATGSAAPTNFDAVKNALKGEVAKALTGNVTVSEQAELDKDFNNASSPAQLGGIAQKYTQLMQGKKDVLHQQYVDGMKGAVDFNTPSTPGGGVMYARDPQGKLHQAPAGTPLPAGWKAQ